MERKLSNIGIGKRIKQKREELGLSQSELAKRMGYTNKTTISKVEGGFDNLTPERLMKFANALNVSPTYLMGLEDKALKAERDGEILNIVRQLNDANAQIVLNLATSLLAQQ